MIYRKATLMDCEKVYSLMCDLEGRELPFEKFRAIYCEQLNSKHYYCLLGEEDHNILAVLNLRFEEQLHHSECIAEIMEFVVDPSCRKQGIGKQTFEKATQIAESYGCTQMEVACNQRRTATHRFYLRGGMNNSHYKFCIWLDCCISESSLRSSESYLIFAKSHSYFRISTIVFCLHMQRSLKSL